MEKKYGKNLPPITLRLCFFHPIKSGGKNLVFSIILSGAVYQNLSLGKLGCIFSPLSLGKLPILMKILKMVESTN